MKEQILEIAEKLRLVLITEYEAQNLLLDLFGISGMVCNHRDILYKEIDLPEFEAMAQTFYEAMSKYCR